MRGHCVLLVGVGVLVHRSRNRVNAVTVELIHHEPTPLDQTDGKEAN
jgi:hypothetical protein